MKLEPGKFYLTYGGQIMEWAGIRPADTCYLRAVNVGHSGSAYVEPGGRLWYWRIGDANGGKCGGFEHIDGHRLHIKKEIRP